MMPQPADLSTPLAWALRYAEIGWHVLPLEPRGKQPLGKLVPRGLHDATTDVDLVRRWWTAAPAANIGIALAQSGLVAVDVDPRNGGAETFEALQVAHGSLRSEVMAFTGGGGEHHVFQLPHGAQVSLPGTLGPGIDLKCNGYIVVEPSIHPSGKAYGWEASSNPLDGVVPSPLPDWLRSLRVHVAAPAPAPGDKPVDPRQARDVREALYVLDADDYHQWVQAGMALQATGWGQAAYAMWCAWAQQSDKFDATDSRKKWDSFRAPDQRGGGLSLAWIFGEAQRRGWQNPAKRIQEAEPPEWVGEPVDVEPPEWVDDILPEGEGRDLGPSGALPLLFAEELSDADVQIQQRVEDVVTDGGLVVVFGESHSGKSFLMVDMACAVGAGVEWMGKRTVRGPVLYVAGEGASSIKLRIIAWRRHHGLEPWVAVVPCAVNLLHGDADVQRIKDACRAVEARYGQPVCMVVVDTLARSMAGGNENASEDMGSVIGNAGRIQRDTSAAVAFVHHSGKDATKGSRGHSSLKGAVEAEVEVTADDETKTHTAVVTKQRDLGTKGLTLSAKLIPMDMGVGQWGKPIVTCVVDPVEAVKPKRAANKDKAADLRRAIVAMLAAQPSRSMRRSQLIAALVDAGFKKTPVYDGWARLVADGVCSENGPFAHLLKDPKEVFGDE